jgi:bifunctional non-homologous end joining protein LigD
VPDGPLDALPEAERALLREADPPRSAKLMKAVLHDEPFTDPAWVFERKLDGIRCLAVRDGAGQDVRLLSRNDLSLNGRFPEIATALSEQAPERFALDGEIVAFSGSVTSFEKLARRGHEPGVRVFMYAFDVLHLDGYDTTELPLLSRKALLKRAFDFHDALRFTPHRRGEGEALLSDACRRKWEGLIAKRADSRYSATRSRDWLKLKCSAEQELVIGGYTAPKGSRTDFGALLVGHFEGDDLRYAGKVGTGFDQATLRDVHARMTKLERGDSPFVDEIRERGATWVEPELVAQVGFTEWTRDGRLRHPRFLGLREDKAAREVVRERPS